ncbi:MAG: DUF6868 family protein [Pirellulales bacterium]
MSDAHKLSLNLIAKVLLRCWLLGMLLLLVWFGMNFLAGGLIHQLHGKLFGLSPHELDLIIYVAMIAAKLIVLLFFLLPWAAIRLVIWRGAKQ